MSVFCRLALEKDRAELKALGADMVAELTPHLTFNPGRVDVSISRAFANANPTIFVAEDDIGLLGFLVANRVEYAACAGFYIEQQLFYVRPDARGTRAAAKLFAGFVRWAEYLHPEEVFAGIGWGRRSAAAARWLRRFGFEPAGQQIMRRRMGG